MRLHDKFTFGKYKGLSLEEVFRGKNSINKELMISYLEHRISLVDAEVPELFKQYSWIWLMNFEISETIMRVTPIIDNYELKKECSESLEKLFAEDPIMNLIVDCYSLDEYSTNKFSKKKEIISGNPSYIYWCIENINSFYVDKSALEHLEKNIIYKYKGIKITHKVEDIYEYFPIIDKIIYTAPKHILNKNNEKYKLNNNWDSDSDYSDYNHDKRTFDNYNGSFAQGMEGWSDQDIDDAFGGEADAYWNID